MAKDWEDDKTWSDRFIPEIQRILGQTFFTLPTLSDDQLRNTDLICMDLSGKRIGCRIRRNEYALRYRTQFTIRYSRPLGTKTEYQKILDGWGDYFFYGFSSYTEDYLIFWIIIDLDVFRDAVLNSNIGISKENTDGSSGFKVFNWSDFPGDLFLNISPFNLYMSDACEKCLCRKIPYKQEFEMICPECLELSDFTFVANNYFEYLKSLNIKG